MAELMREGLGTEEPGRTENPGMLPSYLSEAGMRKLKVVEVERTRSNVVNHIPFHA